MYKEFLLIFFMNILNSIISFSLFFFYILSLSI